MKRNMDLVREILQHLEASPKARNATSIEIEGHSDEEISYHVKLLEQAGLVEAIDASTMARIKWIPVSLTWHGHEFLEVSRNDTMWDHAKTLVTQKAGGMAFDVLKAALLKLAESAIQT